MSKNTTLLSTTKRRALEAMASGASIEAAAVAAGVARSTLYRWLADDQTFTEALQQAQTMALDAFVIELVSMTAQVAQAIRDALDSDDINVRLRAASLFTARLLSFKELHEYERRLAELERRSTP